MAFLVVDDSDENRNEIMMMLLKENYVAYAASDGEQGFNAFKKNADIDIIITDFNMPKLDGIQMIEKIQNEIDRRRPEIFMITSEQDINLRKKAKELGVKYWMTKPFHSGAFLSVIRKLLIAA